MKLLLATITNNKNNKGHLHMAAFLITQNRTRRTKRSLETMKGDIS